MSITVDVDLTKLNAKVLALTEATGKTLAEELPAEGGRLAITLMKYTQPFGMGVDAKRKGEATVERDYNRVYPTEETNLAGEIASYARPKDRVNARIRFLRYLQSGNVGYSEKMLRDMHVQIDYSQTADPSYHKARWKHGKLYRGKVQAVLKVGSLRRLIAQGKKKVGFGKDGWSPAARQLGQGKNIPAWIGRHGAPGTAIVDTKNPMNVSVTIINSVDYTDRVLSQSAKRKAVDERAGMISSRIDMILKARLKKVSEKS